MLFNIQRQLLLFKQLMHLQLLFGKSIFIFGITSYAVVLFIKRKNFISTISCLKYHWLTRCEQLVELSVVDYVSKSYRFFISYHMLSLLYNQRFIIYQVSNEMLSVTSICHLYSSGNWLEREVWDMFGVVFNNHPDLRRILTDYGFFGHPLRKDFPLSGFYEVFFNDLVQLVNYQKISLAQEFRDFTTLQNPWIQRL
jgi:NADH:ubiquinone oxidoreductase subunit C